MFSFINYLNSLNEKDIYSPSPALVQVQDILGKVGITVTAFYRSGGKFHLETKEDGIKASFEVKDNIVLVEIPDVVLKPQEIDTYLKMVQKVRKAAFELDALIASIDPKDVLSI